MDFNKWLNQSLGAHIDVDGAYGDQCVDVAMSWAQFCFPPHKWPELLGYGNAKDLYAASNPAFFDKLQSDPQRGDMVVFGATATNPYGHIAVIIGANSSQMNVIEQNGFNPSGVAYTAQRPYINIIGYLRPKGVNVANTQATADEVNDLCVGMTGLEAKTNQNFLNNVGIPISDAIRNVFHYTEAVNFRNKASDYDNIKSQLDAYKASNGELAKWQAVKALLKQIVPFIN